VARIRTGIHGATGRMGRAIAALIATDYADRMSVDVSIGSRTGDLQALLTVDVIFDVSLPDGTTALVDWLTGIRASKPAIVCGTTGLDATIHARLLALGESRRVLYAPNFSAGVAALHQIVAFAAPLLADLGYTPAITETHHEHKRDAPSGTARSLQETLAPADPASVETQSIRTGEVIGKHEVTFVGQDDEIVLTHDARDRRLFARGAIEAALWLATRSGVGADTMDSYFRKRFLDRPGAEPG